MVLYCIANDVFCVIGVEQQLWALSCAWDRKYNLLMLRFFKYSNATYSSISQVYIFYLSFVYSNENNTYSKMYNTDDQKFNKKGNRMTK